MDVHGDPDKAGFVQVMQGRACDLDRARALMAQNPGEMAAFRPDVIGSMTVGHEGEVYTLAFYFTSEQAVRDGEREEPPARLKAQMEELNQLSIGEPGRGPSPGPGWAARGAVARALRWCRPRRFGQGASGALRVAWPERSVTRSLAP